MKKLFLAIALLLSPGLGLCQATITGGPTPGLAQPDCNLPFSFAAAGSSASFDNRAIGCSSWHLMYYADGCTVTAIQPQFAPDNSGVAGAFSIFSATQVFGTIPLTSNTESQVTFSGFHPWVNVRLVTATNCTLVAGRMIGWKAQGSSEATAAANPSQGTAAEGTPSVGFPQQVGGRFETTPTVLANGQQGVFQQDANQNLLTRINPKSFVYITTATTTTVKSTSGTLHRVVVNTPVASATIKVFNLAGASCTGTPSTNAVAVITIPSTITSESPFFQEYNYTMSNGICVLTSGATDLDVVFE